MSSANYTLETATPPPMAPDKNKYRIFNKELKTRMTAKFRDS